MGKFRYPCRRCKRVEDPLMCENKHCNVWRAWFVQRWDRTRSMYIKEE